MAVEILVPSGQLRTSINNDTAPDYLIATLRSKIGDTYNPVPLLTLRYIGTGAAEISIDESKVTVLVTDPSSVEVSTTPYEYAFADFPTLKSIFLSLLAKKGISGSKIFSIAYPEVSVYNPSASSNGLDDVVEEELDATGLVLRYKYAFSDSELSSVLKDAAIKHCDRYAFWESVAPRDEPLIVKLAWIEVCKVLATDSAKFYAINAGETIYNKSERVRNYLSVAADLTSEYALEMETAEIDEIKITTVAIDRDRDKAVRPGYADMPPRAVGMLSVVFVSPNLFDVEWERCLENDFKAYEVFMGINIAGVTKDNGVLIFQTFDQRVTKQRFELSSITANATYYFVVYAVDLNNQKTKSNVLGASV